MERNDEHLWELAWNDPTISLLKRILYHAVESMGELSKEQFDILLKPIVLPGCISASYLARKALQLEGDDLVTNARLVSFGHDYLVFTPKGLSQYENAIVKRAERCLLQDGPPEVCFHCRFSGPLECKSINPNHIMIVTASMTNGFRNCEFIIKNKEQVINNPKDYGKKIRDLPINPSSDDSRLQLAKEYLTYNIHFVILACVNNYGEQELHDRMRYRMLVEGMRYHLGIQQGSKDREIDLLRTILQVMDLLAIGWELKEDDDAKKVTISSCPFSIFPPYLCHLMGYFYSGICMGNGTGMEFVQVGRTTEGASGCQYILRQIPPENRKWMDY